MSRVNVVFSSTLTNVTNGERNVDVQAATLGEALDKLAERYGNKFKEKILDPNGKPKRLLNIYINGRNILFLDLLKTPLKDGDEITILPSVSGG
ncbi:MAG: MoaD family protein [Thermoproteota archaeon]